MYLYTYYWPCTFLPTHSLLPIVCKKYSSLLIYVIFLMTFLSKDLKKVKFLVILRRKKMDYSINLYRPWSFKPVIDITGWYFFPVILFLSFPDKFIYSASINWPIGNALMKPITDCKQQEQDYRQKMSACNVSYRHKRSGPK